ncbi:E3 ubiquitin-protein ligase SINA-like 2 [Hordeum vulgare subsp. vulgare]|uniref:RING-type E3 ubiquitin transferase n=1 Tax=Hordeum vulgare subsp. vulgare TaxID=112509 RepID=A0A8I7B4K2_HORVV|nr:E3 ubiquitin-protein ligase SINA-like 2 [Hordeum vulgare subsp. vulgare]
MEAKSDIINKEGEGKQNVTMRMDVFNCSICSKPLGPPIFQCSKGNSICSACCEQLPESKRAAVHRCYIMERVVDNMFVSCKHGCGRKMTYYRQDTHERECPIGPCMCPVSGCGFVAPAVVLLDHLTTLHKLPTTQVELFMMFHLPVQAGSQVLCSRNGRLFLLEMASLGSFGHAVFLVCVRPETPRATVDAFVEFSCFEGHFHASKLKIIPDGEPRQCLCVVPAGREISVHIGISIWMEYLDNDELQEEEEKEMDELDDAFQEFDYDFDQDEEDDAVQEYGSDFDEEEDD